MVPLIELRGAIPIAQSMGLPIMTSYLVCIVGNMIPVPFIYLFARKVLEWGADKPVIGGFFTFCLEKGRKGGRKLTEKVPVRSRSVCTQQRRTPSSSSLCVTFSMVSPPFSWESSDV